MSKTYNYLIILALMLTLNACGGTSTDKKSNAKGSGMALDLSSYPLADLNSEQMYALAHMWNEEKLAHDLYLALNDVHAAKTLSNIATNSETKHIALVEDLVQRYDINITNLGDYTINYSEAELRALKAGVFGVPEMQTLYDDLYHRGTVNLQAALEVGCMVEVVDVNDLDIYIEDVSYPQDLVDTFKILRDGSYKHYWAFDSALQNMGVAEGCCVLGDTYCKTSSEYPQ